MTAAQEEDPQVVFISGLSEATSEAMAEAKVEARQGPPRPRVGESWLTELEVGGA